MIYLGLLLAALVGGIFTVNHHSDHRSNRQPVPVSNGPVAPIPEPSSYVLFGVGGLVVGYAIRKQK